VKEIELTKNKTVLVDDSDFEWLNRFKWFAQTSKNTYYAARSMRVNGKCKTILMHRVILGLDFGDKREGDHRNVNSLDCQRHNLRICTHAQNRRSKIKLKGQYSSKYKGVSLDKQHNKWFASIMFNYKYYFLGRFKSEEKAARKYDEKALELHGEFAMTNKMLGLL